MNSRKAAACDEIPGHQAEYGLVGIEMRVGANRHPAPHAHQRDEHAEQDARQPERSAIGDHFASGSGLIWKCITLLVVPLPVSMWNGVRVLIVA